MVIARTTTAEPDSIPESMTLQPTAKLAELINAKHQVLLKLREVGQRQAELAGQGDVPELLSLLAAKQTLIDGLQQIERELGPFRNDDPDRRVWPDAEARSRCAKQADDCNELLNEILYLEKQSEDAMIARRDQVATQLRQVYSAGQARGAYEAHQPHSGSVRPARAAATANESMRIDVTTGS